jgi:hypothetical protein
VLAEVVDFSVLVLVAVVPVDEVVLPAPALVVVVVARVPVNKFPEPSKVSV